MNKKYDTLVFIGRFQPFHNAHLEIIEYAMEISKKVIVIVGSSIKAQIASISSRKLCGGIFVAIPTAIPVDPFINKPGRLAGRTEGSVVLSL